MAGLWPLLLTAGAWELCAFYTGSRFLPHLPTVGEVLWTSLGADAIIQAQGGGARGYVPHIWATLQSFTICMGLGSASAYVTAVTLFPWSGSRHVLQALLRPWHVIPPLIVIPLLFAALGPSPMTFRLVAGFYAFVATAVLALDALHQVPQNYVLLARLASAGPLWITWRVRAVAITPMLLGPVKAVASFTLGVVVVLEYLAAPEGIGRVMKFAVSYNSVSLILAGIFWAAAIGFSFGLCVDALGYRFLPWAARTGLRPSLKVLAAPRLARRENSSRIK